jgi:serine/threonine protein phosphatase PrpC
MPAPDESDTLEYFVSSEAAGSQAPQPFSSRVHVDFGGQSHVGKVRPSNQDAYLIYRTGRYWERLLTNLPEGELPERHEEIAYAMAVGDGMGGVAGGEVASSLSLRTGVHLILHAVKWALKLDHPEEREKEINEGIERGLDYFARINRAVLAQGRADPALAGMGTTLTASYSFGDDLFLFHVGDSRAYLYRQGRLRQLTRDHTMAQALADAGLIEARELPQHRLRHVLTRCLGQQGGPVQTEVHQLQLADRDRLLLCSDGLHGMVEDGKIAAILAKAPSSQEACGALVDAALERGGKDNVTVLVADYRMPPRPGAAAGL